MRTPLSTHKAAEKILLALAEFDYLTASQITRLLYAPSSLTHVREKLKFLHDEEYIFALPRQSVILPRVFTLSGKGRTYVSTMLGQPVAKRFRAAEEEDKAGNFYFLNHTLAVIDVLITARLLSETVPGITLNRIFTERSLRRKIYVAIPDAAKQGGGESAQKVCIEPDASLDFTIQGKWQDFFHIEVYRHLPVEWRWKQKVTAYVTYTATGQHNALFHTPALSIAVLAETPEMAKTLKHWTEEVLQAIERPKDGDWFFFCCLDVSKATPEEMFLSPVWQQAFSTTKTPLLTLE